jgi:hypothetical protein
MNAQSQSAPAPGRPLGSLGARGRRQQLVTACVEALGGKARITAIQMTDIERVVDLIALAKTARAALAGGRAKVADVVKLEGTLARAMKRLNLPAPNAAAPVPTLAEYLAQRTTDEPEAGDTT